MEADRFETVDQYIASQPAKVQTILKKIRKTIKKVVPQAEERISYNIPAYKYCGYVVYFAAHSNHIGLYPAPRNAPEFKARLATYAGGKGTVQFPYDQPVPYDLIEEIVRFRVALNLSKAAGKKKKPATRTRKGA